MSSVITSASYSLLKGNLQNSERVVWNTKDNLGRGATAVVYLGRIKSTGYVVAVKVFHQHIHMVAGGEEVRELELLQRLKHENIITLFSIERELISKQVVLVMEYCEGGSLYHMLDQPKYGHGLPEEEFLLVLKHVAAGIAYLRQHGIIHRDIKPGNIMRFITEEGRSIYKLTDFGAARQLHEEENFTSLYGTEEYLHPGMYETAVLRLPTGQSFDAKVDLWSLGVTFYHVVTGDLPFKPYGGRDNREKMFEITSQKAPGVISRVQNSHQGPIISSSELPPSCPLSSGLKKLLVPLLAGLMETDDTRVISYETFFHSVNSINGKIRLTVFHVTSCIILTFYLDSHSNYSTLKEYIASQTEVSANDQLLLLDGRHLEDIIEPTDDISTYPLHVLHATIFLYQNDMKSQDIEKIIHPNIPQVAKFDDNVIDMDRDLKLAHGCSVRAHLVKRYTEETVRKQELLVQAELCLRLYLLFRLKCSGERFLTMSQLVTEFKKRLQTFYSMLDMIRVLLNILKYPIHALDDIAKDNTLTAVHTKAEERTREIVNYRTALVERLDQDQTRMKKWCARCKDTDCLSKVEYHLSVITSIQSRFRRDKNVKDQMTQHDQHIHGLERQKLQDQCVAIASIPHDHCYRNLDIMYSESMNFFGALSKNLNRISKIEKNIESVIDCQQLLSTKLDKIEVNCKDAYERAQSWVQDNQNGRLQPTAPPEYVGELTVTVTEQGKSRDEGLGTSYGMSRDGMQGAGVSRDPTKETDLPHARPFSGKDDSSLMTSATDISNEVRSLMNESMSVARLVEENTELIRKLEESTLQSSGSLSTNLTKK